MKWLPLLWTALRRKPARTVYTLLSIVIAFLLVGIMSGLNAAFAERIENARVDRIVVTARYGVCRLPISIRSFGWTASRKAFRPRSSKHPIRSQRIDSSSG